LRLPPTTNKNGLVHAQVAIAGAGPAGCAAALTLLHSGISVILLDGSHLPLQRGEILPGSVRALLETLRVWPNFLELDPVPIMQILSAWGSPSMWVNDLSLHPFGCSWAIQRDAFDQMLREAAITAGAVYLRASLRAARHHKGSWLTQGRALTRSECAVSNFVVDATGKVSAFARAMGVEKRRVDRLLALSTVLEAGHNAFSFSHVLSVETCPNGWWYSTPLPNSQLTLSFLTDPGELSTQTQYRVQRWQHALEGCRFIKEQLRLCGPVATVNVSPAFSASLERFCGQGWLAVGDAASSVDPLCGAGVARALEAGIECAKCIQASLDGRTDAMQAYEAKERRAFVNAEKMRAFEYAREAQWPNQPFWKSRKALNTIETPTFG
jgi:flavin-dependent dehydrogenase